MTDERGTGRAGETKGERTRNRIVAEARALIDEQGIAAVSQEAVAKRVGLSQSALRHHFPMKDDMFDAIFDHVFASFYRWAERVLLEPEHTPRERLMLLVQGHLDQVTGGSDRVALESFAHYLRNPEMLSGQSAWYQWLAGHYATLIGSIRPELDEAERRTRGLAILTLCLGAWITIGRSRPEWPSLPGSAARDALTTAVGQLVDS